MLNKGFRRKKKKKRTCVTYPEWKISGILRWGEVAISSRRQTRTIFGWETGMGNRHALWANRLGTAPGEMLEMPSLVTSRMSFSNSKLPIIQ